MLRLMAWHRKNYRTYPFRNERDPYKILVAEILLRQTRADQVSRVYPILVREYPTIAALSKARVRHLRKVMHPLGIASRASDLLAIAAKLEMDFEGHVPHSNELLMQLPGVGEYICNSVLVRAYHDNRPLVDVNVRRVLSRIFVGAKQVGKDDANEIFMNLTEFMSASELNHAIIDLAHSVCSNKRPKCCICPVSEQCCHVHKSE